MFFNTLDNDNSGFPFEVINMDKLVKRAKKVLLEKIVEPDIESIVFIAYKLDIPVHKFFESELFK